MGNTGKRLIRGLVLLLMALMLDGCTADDRRGTGGEGDGGVSDAAADADVDADADGDADAGDGGFDCYDKIDICFVLDVSTSMGFVLDKLNQEIGKVWQAALNIDDDPSFGLVVFVDDVAVQNNGQPFASVSAIQQAFQTVKAYTSSEQEPGGSPGINLDCPENTLDALVTAAETYPWREDSVRIIIHATDDTFKETPAKLSQVKVQHTYPETIQALTSRELRVASFAAHQGTCTGSGNTEAGFFTPYGGQPSIPTATGGHVFDIRQVAAGNLSLADAITDVIISEYCTPYVQ